MKKENEKGIISLVILFTMLFLLVFCLSAYFLIRNRLQVQDYKNAEIQEIYSKDVEDISIKNSNTEIIPISNIEQLNVAGTGNYLKIGNSVYECTSSMTYLLKDNIIVDINEDLISGKVGFNDYKLYSSNFYFDKSIYDIYYYKDGYYWKNIAYERFSNRENKNFATPGTYLRNSFSSVNGLIPNSQYEFMMISSDSDGKLTNQNNKIQMITSKITNINQIDVFKENYNNQNEIYLFVKLGNSI